MARGLEWVGVYVILSDEPNVNVERSRKDTYFFTHFPRIITLFFEYGSIRQWCTVDICKNYHCELKFPSTMIIMTQLVC